MRRGRHVRARCFCALLLLRAGSSGAAAFVPGAPEADPPTGATGRLESELAVPAAGDGIRWEFARIRWGGTLSFDARRLRLEDGSRSSQGLVYNDIEMATHVWQPWFIQLRAGAGLLASRDQATPVDGATQSSTGSVALTGRVALSVFPVSRFPFEFRAEVADSRAGGDSLGADFRTYRLGVTQAWRPESGGDNVNASLDYSRLESLGGIEDTVITLRGTALRQLADHSFELSAQLSGNDRSDSEDRTRIGLLNGRHAFHPGEALHVDTLASWNEVRLKSGDGGSRFDSRSDVRQISSFATWRPREGDALYWSESPMYLTGSVRLLDAGAETESNLAFAEQHARAFNGTLGASIDLTREWRISGGVSAGYVHVDDQPRSLNASGTGGATWTPQGLVFGDWRYSPSVGASGSVTRSSQVALRHAVGVQASHGLARTWLASEADSISFNVTQSLGVLHESQSPDQTRALSHSASVYWQGASDGATQSYAGVSFSDSRTRAQDTGNFQLVNMQFSRRTQLTRDASWSGNLTWQSARSDSTQLDPFTGTLREAGLGWQRFYSGSLSYEHQRFLDTPRLRYALILTVNSQQLESRAIGDVDAPLERITESLESRLDYSIGRLEARLTARLARVEGRSVQALFARVQRRY
jgi:hypothetical protein